MRHFVGMFVATLAVACAPGSVFYQPSESEAAMARMTPEQWFEHRWTGRMEDDVLLRFGKPTDVLPLSSGNQIFSYHYETAASSSRAFANAYGGGARSDSQDLFCDRRFEIDRTSRKVLRCSIRGNGCKYDD